MFNLVATSCADPENSARGDGSGGPGSVFSYFKENCADLPREAIGPEGSNCISKMSVPEFLRKHIATCGFPGGVRTPCPPPPLDPPMHFLMKNQVMPFRGHSEIPMLFYVLIVF